MARPGAERRAWFTRRGTRGAGTPHGHSATRRGHATLRPGPGCSQRILELVPAYASSNTHGRSPWQTGTCLPSRASMPPGRVARSGAKRSGVKGVVSGRLGAVAHGDAPIASDTSTKRKRVDSTDADAASGRGTQRQHPHTSSCGCATRTRPMSGPPTVVNEVPARTVVCRDTPCDGTVSRDRIAAASVAACCGAFPAFERPRPGCRHTLQEQSGAVPAPTLRETARRCPVRHHRSVCPDR